GRGEVWPNRSSSPRRKLRPCWASILPLSAMPSDEGCFPLSPSRGESCGSPQLLSIAFFVMRGCLLLRESPHETAKRPGGRRREGRRWALVSAGHRRLYGGPVLILTHDGPQYAEPHNDAQRAAAGRHWAWVRAVDRADEQGRRPPEPPADVRRLARNGIGGVHPTTDTGRVLDLLAEGELDDLPPISPKLADDEELEEEP